MVRLLRLFDASYRKARAREAEGDYRTAAALYAEAGAKDEAVNALLFFVTHATSAADKVAGYTSALRFMEPTDPRRKIAEIEIARATLLDVAATTPLHADDRARALTAALALEGHDEYADAVRGYELLGDTDAVARCLTKSGDVDRLESVLARDVADDGRARDTQMAMRAYEDAMRLGARSDARAALVRAREISPNASEVEAMLQRLDARFPERDRLELRVGEARAFFVGKWPVRIGRDADIAVRGTSVSRVHCELAINEIGVLTVRDLESRNGTLVARMPIQGSFVLEKSARIGLGDDVQIAITHEGSHVRVEVLEGPDRGVVALVGESELPVPGAPAFVSFVDGRASLAARGAGNLRLGGVATAMPVVLLRADSLELDDVRIEVAT